MEQVPENAKPWDTSHVLELLCSLLWNGFATGTTIEVWDVDLPVPSAAGSCCTASFTFCLEEKPRCLTVIWKSVWMMLTLGPPKKENTEAMNKPYDIKTSCWVKDEKRGFLSGEIQSEKDDKVVVNMVINQLSSTWMEWWMMNPPEFNDMANMTFLNKASILDNLCQHYTHMRIYDLKGQREIAKQHGESLEDQIIQVSPALETLDNAKTTWKANLSEFTLVAQARWLGLTLRAVAFDVLGFSPEDRICVYKLTRGIMDLGTMKFKQKPREEQAEVESMEINMLIFPPIMADKVTQLMGLKSVELQRGITSARTRDLERMCMFPKATDTLKAAKNNHLGKSPSFLKPKGGQGKGEEAHFEHCGALRWHVYQGMSLKSKNIISPQHPFLWKSCRILYSGQMGFPCITAWLQKNEDPLNEAVVGLLQKSSMPLLWVLFKEEEAAGRVNVMQYNQYCQLNVSELVNYLMTALHSTSPHFIHCIVPNDFEQSVTLSMRNPRRYQSLNPSIIPPGFVDSKKASELLLGPTDLGGERSRRLPRTPGSNSLLSSNIFFCAGILATLEDMKDEPLAKVMTMLQCHAHGFLMRIEMDNSAGFLDMELRSIMSKTQELTEHTGAEEQIATLSQEKNDLPIQLQAEQENLLDAEECLAQMMKSKTDEPDPGYDRADMSASRQKLKDLSDLKCDLEGLETTLTKTEKEKQALDQRVTLTSDLSAQNDSVTKFQKEKRALEEVYNCKENKVNQLTKNNSKPTTQMHELEGKWEQEKTRGKVKNAHHRAESDLKMLTIANLSEMKAKLGRGCKEAHTLRSWKKTWKLSVLWRNKEDCLEEAGVATTAQIQNCKQEAGLLKLLLGLEEAALQSEAMGSVLCRKHTGLRRRWQSSWRIPKVKANLETDKEVTKAEMDDLSVSMESLQKSKLNSDAHVHRLEDYLSANAQLAEVEKSQAEINASRLQGKFLDSFVQCYLPLILLFPYISSNSGSPALQLSREHEEAQSRHNQIVHIKISLTLQADDFKRQPDEESESCPTAVVSLANTKHDLDPVKELEEEEENKAELQCLVSKHNTEIIIWRTKYKTDAIERTEELEETKTKLSVRLQEAETAESVQAWVTNTKKTKRTSLLTSRRQEIQPFKSTSSTSLITWYWKPLLQYQWGNAACAALDKKQRAFDKMLAEWQQKCKELQVEMDSSQKECTHLKNFELKTACEESLEHLESMREGNRTLQEEIKDLINQLEEGGVSIHELQKMRLEIEKDELQVALEEAESSLEVEESKLICIQLKRAQVKADIDRTHEKEDFETTRNNHQHAIESLQVSLETEVKGSAETLRLNKMDTDLTSTEMQLDHANENGELVRTPTKLQQHVKTELEEVQTRLEGSEHCHKLLEQVEVIERHNKLNVHMKELEIELDSKQKHHVETKILHKNKRHLKELDFTKDGHKTNQCMQEQLEKTQNKLTHKRQTEEAEASQSLAKERKTVHELDDAEERQGMAESALNELHSRRRVSASKGLTFGEIN
ncbi:LOW QUALITY PROTEIN: uncharacterized protein MYH16 [Morus bassanus]